MASGLWFTSWIWNYLTCFVSIWWLNAQAQPKASVISCLTMLQFFLLIIPEKEDIVIPNNLQKVFSYCMSAIRIHCYPHLPTKLFIWKKFMGCIQDHWSSDLACRLIKIFHHWPSDLVGNWLLKDPIHKPWRTTMLFNWIFYWYLTSWSQDYGLYVV